MNRLPKVLCIEDQRDTLELLAEVLAEAGYDPVVAQDGIEGVRKLGEQPDLVLCDVDLPHLTGFGVLRELRKSPGAVHRIPFLFITAYGSRQNHLTARRLGCDDFITKPVDFELLLEIVRNRLASGTRLEQVPVTLTEREIEALTWVARGKSSADIATLLSVSERTVNFHVNNVIQKLGVATRVQAAIRCALLGLIEL